MTCGLESRRYLKDSMKLRSGPDLTEILKTMDLLHAKHTCEHVLQLVCTSSLQETS